MTESGDNADREYVLVSDRTHHDADQFEVIADVRLREACDINDGDVITIDATR